MVALPLAMLVNVVGVLPFLNTTCDDPTASDVVVLALSVPPVADQ